MERILVARSRNETAKWLLTRRRLPKVLSPGASTPAVSLGGLPNVATGGSPSETQAAPERQVEAEIELASSPAFEPEQVLTHALEALELRGARRPEGVVGGAAGVGIPVPLLAGSVGGGSLPHGALDLDPAVA